MRKVLLITILSMMVACQALAITMLQSFEAMLCKEWKARYFEEGGQKTYPDDAEANDRFIFHANHTAEIREAGETQDGLWQYDQATKRLVITNRVTKEKMTMTVITITPGELVLKFVDDSGVTSVAHMMPVK